MKKNVQRINESQLRTIVVESVKKVLNDDNTRKRCQHYMALCEENPHLINGWEDNLSDSETIKQHNTMWDGEDEEILVNTDDMHIFKPSEKWQEDSNEINFMGGQTEDEDNIYELKEFVGQEVRDAAQQIIKQCKYLTTSINNNQQDEYAYEREQTSFVVDVDGTAYAIINVDPYSVITFKTYRGLFGTHYMIDTPSAADNGAEHFCYRGQLQYNLNKKEGKYLFCGIIKSILKSVLNSDDYNYNDIMELLPDDSSTLSAIREAFRILVKTYKHFVDVFGGKSIPTPKNAGFGVELSRQWQSMALSESLVKHAVSESIKKKQNYKNMKKVQRINESQLKAIVAESVKRILQEMNFNEPKFYSIFLDEECEISNIEPLCCLSSENIQEIEDDDPEITVNGKTIYIPSEYYNTSDCTPQIGDYLFETIGGYSIYRIGGEYGVTGSECAMGDSILIGTKQDLMNWFVKYANEIKNDYGINPQKIIEKIKML